MITDSPEQGEQALIEGVIEDRPDHMLVRIIGRASFDQAEHLAWKLLEVIEKAPRLVVVDLAELTHMSSLFVQTLMHFRQAIHRRGGEVRLANLQPRTWHFFAVCGLLKVFPIHDCPE